MTREKELELASLKQYVEDLKEVIRLEHGREELERLDALTSQFYR